MTPEVSSSSFVRELAGLANTRGGTILLGVRDDGTVAGVEDSNKLRARIRDIARKCQPPVASSPKTCAASSPTRSSPV